MAAAPRCSRCATTSSTCSRRASRAAAGQGSRSARRCPKRPSPSRVSTWDVIAGGRRALAEASSTRSDDGVSGPARPGCGVGGCGTSWPHLVILAEGTVTSVLLEGMLVDPRPNRSVDKQSRRLGSSGHAGVARRAAAGRGRRPVRGPRHAARSWPGRVLVHRADLADAAGLPSHDADEAQCAWCWRPSGRCGSPSACPQGPHPPPRPTDADWTVGPPGGPAADRPRRAAPADHRRRLGTTRMASPDWVCAVLA